MTKEETQKIEHPTDGDLIEEEEETTEAMSGTTPPKITLSDAKMFKEGISSIGELVSEANIKLDEKGLTILCMDPANVAMMEFVMTKEAFTEYNISEPKEVILNVLNLHQILKRVNKDSILILEFGETHIKMNMLGNIKKEFTLPLIEDDTIKEQKKPELQHGATAEIDLKVLKEGFEDIEIVAESVVFTAKDNKFSLAGEGDISNVDINMMEAVKVSQEEYQQAKYALEYLKKMTPTKIFNTVKVSFKTDYPLLLEYKDEAGHVKLSYILAPRIESG